jgi:hypothetical protein
MAATKCGHLDPALCGSLHLYWGLMTRDALPLSVRHFHPRIGVTLLNIKRLSRRISAGSFKDSRNDGRIAKYSYLHIIDLGIGIFRGFRVCQRLGPVGNFSIGSRIMNMSANRGAARSGLFVF